MRSVYYDKRKTIYRVSIFFLSLLIITVSVVLEVKAEFSYKVLDRVTHSLCTSHSIVKNLIRVDILGVWEKIFAYVKPPNKGFIILLFFILQQFGGLFFDMHPTALSERSVRIFPLFSSVTPHIFRVRYPNRYNGVIVELCRI